jgi:hypothetical protein
MWLKAHRAPAHQQGTAAVGRTLTDHRDEGAPLMPPGVCSTCGGAGRLRQGGYYQGQIQEWYVPCPSCCNYGGGEDAGERVMNKMFLPGLGIALLLAVLVGVPLVGYELATDTVLLPETQQAQMNDALRNARTNGDSQQQWRGAASGGAATEGTKLKPGYSGAGIGIGVAIVFAIAWWLFAVALGFVISILAFFWTVVTETCSFIKGLIYWR